MNKWFRFPAWLRCSVLISLILIAPLIQAASSAVVYAQSSSVLQAHANASGSVTFTAFRSHPILTSPSGKKMPPGWIPPVPMRFLPSHPIPHEGLGFCQYPNPKHPPCIPPLSLANQNASVLHHPHVLIILWGPKWGDTHNKHYHTYMQIVNTELKLFKRLAGSQYNNLLTQYFDHNGQIVNDKNDRVFQGATLDFTAPPSNLDHSAESQEVQNAINANQGWGNIPDALFMLFPQEGSTYSSEDFCGFHTVTDDNNHIYSVEPYLNDSPFKSGCLGYGDNNIVDAMTVVASHEYAEAATDPWDNNQNTLAWLDQQKANEIGDLCAPEHVALKELGDVTVQNLFDNFGYALSPSRACSTSGALNEYPIPTPNSGPNGITVGPDGNLWFTEDNGDKIGRITPNGTITEYSILTVASRPWGITAGPDGNLWFTEYNGNKIGKITPNGTFTEYPVPTSNSHPDAITTGPDGNLWFSENVGNKIGKITLGGTITEYPIPTSNSNPQDITAGPDGNLWFAEDAGNKIGKITPSGIITEYPIPTSNSRPGGGITSGSDGNLWFTETAGNKIGKITLSGTITEYPIPTNSSGPEAITAGPDGNLWFTEAYANKIGKITLSGTITEYPIPTSNSGPYGGIVTGPDGNLWFTEFNGNKIAKITLNGNVTEYAVPTSNSFPNYIATGPDSNLWFTEWSGSKIAKVILK